MERKRLPNERNAVTHRFTIGGESQNKGYVTVGLYDDGKPGELFVKMDRQGSQVSGFIDAWAIAVSMLLQHGVSIETICEKFRGMSFQPSGMTGNQAIPIAKSPIDYLSRWLEQRFIKETPDEERSFENTNYCEKCGSTNKVHWHNGAYQCEAHRKGKAQNESR